jgi:hypothetical protein
MAKKNTSSLHNKTEIEPAGYGVFITKLFYKIQYQRCLITLDKTALAVYSLPFPCGIEKKSGYFLIR